MSVQTAAAVGPYDPASPEGRAAAAALTRVLDDIEIAMRARGAYPTFSPASSGWRVPGALSCAGGTGRDASAPALRGVSSDGGRSHHDPGAARPAAVALTSGGSL